MRGSNSAAFTCAPFLSNEQILRLLSDLHRPCFLAKHCTDNETRSSVGLDPAKFGTHSLRRTKVVLIYRRTGQPSRSTSSARTFEDRKHGALSRHRGRRCHRDRREDRHLIARHSTCDSGRGRWWEIRRRSREARCRLVGRVSDDGLKNGATSTMAVVRKPQ